MDTNDKPLKITHTYRGHVTIVLDLQKFNYDTWRELFKIHCLTFGIADDLHGSSSSTPPNEKQWKERDRLVKMLIYETISETILHTVLKTKFTS